MNAKQPVMARLSTTEVVPTLPAQAPQGSAASGVGGTYGQILKSSAVIGGSTAVKIALGMVRTKTMAVLLGPAGLGLMGVYSSIIDLAGTLAGMGINSSGVRQIAEAGRSGNTGQIARTVTVLRRVALALGAIGALLLLAFCRPIARLSFGDDQQAGAVACLGLAVFLGAVSGGQMALVQGLRQIGNLARASIWGGMLGTLLSLLIIYCYGRDGIVAALVCVAATGIATSWWYSRRVQVPPVTMELREISTEVSALLRLGVVFMAGALMSVAVAYLVRILVMRDLGADAAGFYQSAWTLGGLYVGFILQAMGADFFPRLTAVAHDNAECNRLVNEQAEVGLLLAGPGVLGTLTFAPLVIQIFYSSKFGPAVELLRWFCLGTMLQVVSWPMSFMIGAKGVAKTMLWTEALAYATQLGFTWIGLRFFGLTGAGIAFVSSYVLYWLLVYSVVRSLSEFRWSPVNRNLGLMNGSVLAVVFGSWYFLPHLLVFILGTVLTGMLGVYSLRELCARVPLEHTPRPVARLGNLLRRLNGSLGPQAKRGA